MPSVSKFDLSESLTKVVVWSESGDVSLRVFV